MLAPQVDFNSNAANMYAGGRDKLSQRDFKALFFLSSDQTDIAWKLLWDQENIPENTKPHHLLWHLVWVRTYATEDDIHLRFGMDRDTFRVWNLRLEHACGCLGLVR